MKRTFEQLCASAQCTPEERDRLAWHLAAIRQRATYEGLRTEKRCFTYCGQACDCGATEEQPA